MSIKSRPISRRTLLKGAGAALALPWLEAMSPARAHGAEFTPKRMAAMFMPNGVHPGMWTPESEGRDFKISPTLEPMADLKDDLLVLTNLWNQGSNTGDGHYVKAAGYLTCTTINKTVGVDLNSNGISMDQAAAQRIGSQTPLPSLELGTEPVQTGVDSNVGYTRVYGAHIAWRTPTSPLAKEINPRLVYERLFRASRQDPDDARQDKPLLDLVLADANRLRGKLGSADQQRMDEYLHSVRALETRIERASRQDEHQWTPRADVEKAAPRPAGIPPEHAEHVRLMMDMMILAFQTDTTRICTFMFGNSVSNINFSFLDGVDGAHHSTSHHQKNEDMLRQYQLINRWHVEQYAYMVRRLKEIREGEQSLLDNSMVLFGSGLRDGDSHNPHNLPMLLAGRAGGRIATGQHLKYHEDTPLANLYVSMLDAFDTPVERFADSTGPLPGVLATV
ncbi:MAG: DUF1552 domain-containing protein [bacterium]|nr:DUF1552 domain-containing protein [bacterium]